MHLKWIGMRPVSNAIQSLKGRLGAGTMRTTNVDRYDANTMTDRAKDAVKSTVSTVQERLQSGLSKTQGALLVGLDATQELLKEQRKQAAKNLKKAQKRTQKNLKNVRKSVQPGLSQTQEALLTGLGAAQVALEKNARRAGKGLKKTQKNLKETRDAVQSQLERRARKRARAKTMFRIGLLTGVVLMLLYAPWPGSETRRQLVAFWQGLFSRQD